MSYGFSIGAFVVGIILLVPAAFFVKYSNKVADAFGGSYSKYQIYAFVSLGLALFIMLNLHALLAQWLAQTFFGGL